MERRQAIEFALFLFAFNILRPARICQPLSTFCTLSGFSCVDTTCSALTMSLLYRHGHDHTGQTARSGIPHRSCASEAGRSCTVRRRPLIGSARRRSEGRRQVQRRAVDGVDARPVLQTFAPEWLTSANYDAAGCNSGLKHDRGDRPLNGRSAASENAAPSIRPTKPAHIH